MLSDTVSGFRSVGAVVLLVHVDTVLHTRARTRERDHRCSMCKSSSVKDALVDILLSYLDINNLEDMKKMVKQTNIKNVFIRGLSGSVLMKPLRENPVWKTDFRS